MSISLLADTYNSFWLPDQAASIATSSDALFYFIMAINIFFSSLIMALLVYFVFRYRHRKSQRHDPTGGHSTSLELTWTIIPTLLVLVIFYYGFRGYLHANTIPQLAHEITANGQMWKWSFTYPEGFTSDELHLVKNRPEAISLTSSDVIHDLDIPSFRMKKDAVPGRFNRTWFLPTVASTAPVTVAEFKTAAPAPVARVLDDAGFYCLFSDGATSPEQKIDAYAGDTIGFNRRDDGTTVAKATLHGQDIEFPLNAQKAGYAWKKLDYYQVLCAMYCGQNHSTMLAKCIVHETQADYDKWVQDQIVWEGKISFIDRGMQLYKQAGCSTCHSVDGSKGTGPTWKDMYGDMVSCTNGGTFLADDAYVKESIVYPAAKIVSGFGNLMPAGYGTTLKENDIIALTWYMKSISKHYTGDLAPGKTITAPKAAGMTPASPSSASQPATQPAAQMGK